jgi:phenylalanyl-tRNA synthetase beta chain
MAWKTFDVLPLTLPNNNPTSNNPIPIPDMTLSHTWLSDYLKLTLTPEEISDVLTSIGLEVEKVEQWESIPGGLQGVIAGKVLTCARHPDADRLSVTTVDIGNETPSHIVCGANNIAAGQTVWVAVPGTNVFDKTGKPFTINVSKIRGQQSEGMICAEDELGLGNNHDGIIVLPNEVQVGTKASDYYKITTDTLFEIGLTPNRSDATSVIGVANDIAACLSVKDNMFYPVLVPEIKELVSDKSSGGFTVEIRNETACPRYSGLVIEQLQIGPSPSWMQQRLQAIGVKSINNVVDITNFVLHEMGQPLHAFDASKIAGNKIIVETKPMGTPFLALDGTEYKLHEEDLMICDGDGKPMCIGGVYGGLNSGVSESTAAIFLEAAHFNAGYVRRTSMRHNLRTEAAKRFEKGSDPSITAKALSRAAALMVEYAGGRIASSVIDIYPTPILPTRVTLNRSTVSSKTGVPFTSERIDHILQALKMEYTKQGDDVWQIDVPMNKPDVLREVDVIEEILRIHGFINVELPAKMQLTVAIESRHHPHRYRRLIGQWLAANGFLECMNMSLTQPAYYRDVTWVKEAEWVTIHNTSNESLNLMRPEMMMPMLETIKRNVARRQDNLRLFEFGKSYRQQNELPSESEHLIITMTGMRSAESWLSKSPGAADFFALKEVVEGLLGRLGIKKTTNTAFTEKDGYAFGQIISDGELQVGIVGCVENKYADAFDIRHAVYMADFNLEALINVSTHHQVIYDELNRFPAVIRDLAIVINSDVPFDRIREVASKAGGAWLTNLEVFDIYKNAEHVGEGKMSMALRFTIENKEATLTDKEIDHWFNNMQKALSEKLGAAIRK